ncbi:MAG: BAX inhibitor (BI)-1/YccA family protein, partial [Bacteroidaceae bacterium]|nr:BAX inhibitor (BI)-1/YccA family protein [Bacteroidaceae bacterium]
MEYSQLEKMINQREAAIEHSFPALMKKVYLWMTFALIITGMTSWLVASSPALISAIFNNSILFWGLIIAEFGL